MLNSVSLSESTARAAFFMMVRLFSSTDTETQQTARTGRHVTTLLDVAVSFRGDFKTLIHETDSI